MAIWSVFPAVEMFLKDYHSRQNFVSPGIDADLCRKRVVWLKDWALPARRMLLGGEFCDISY